MKKELILLSFLLLLFSLGAIATDYPSLEDVGNDIKVLMDLKNDSSSTDGTGSQTFENELTVETTPASTIPMNLTGLKLSVRNGQTEYNVNEVWIVAVEKKSDCDTVEELNSLNDNYKLRIKTPNDSLSSYSDTIEITDSSEYQTFINNTSGKNYFVVVKAGKT
jgi:hypothetical protein